jgi:hypothetical protein
MLYNGIPSVGSVTKTFTLNNLSIVQHVERNTRHTATFGIPL